MIARVLLIGAAFTGCGSPPRTEAAQTDNRSPDELVAERIRNRIEAAGVVADLRAGGEPVYASAVLPNFYVRRLYRPAWSDAHGLSARDDPILTAKIAWAHLQEIPDYYTRLDAMEAAAG